MTDLQLIELFLSGSEKAFEFFYKNHKDNIFRFVLAMTNGSNATEDICASIWEKFIHKCKHIKSNPVAYLYAIARSKSLDYLRSKPNNIQENTEHLMLTTPNLEQNIALSKTLISINALPFEQKEALLLKYFAGYSLEEIAKYQDVNCESAKSRIRYALNKIRLVFAGENS